ncbi:MAG TPA: glycerophosphoryl diester phosphodiesterase membrane domain-containing protein [Actinomycetaceae bacterium]|nr:glycerophosphoryl diester phosphodiesterase membrane domain-containing protein [Actinomycetaceae bacterium]
MSQQSGPDGPIDPHYGPYGQQGQAGDPGQVPPRPPGPPPGDPGAYGQYGPPPTGDQYGQYGQPPSADQYGQYAQPPASAQPPAPGQPPAGGQPGEYGQYGQYGQPAPTGYYGPGFVPVPTAVQPGIIPLRPLTLGEIYDGAFRAIRSNPMVMFGLAIIVVGAGSVLQLGFTAALAGQVERAARSGVVDFSAFISLGSLAGLLLSSVAIGLATLVLEGLAIISVSESVLGRKIPLAEVWRRARGKIWRLIGLSLVLTAAGVLAMVIGLTIIVAVVVGAVEGSSGSSAMFIFLVLVPLVFIALVLVIGFFAIRIMLATCVIMLEETGVFASIARSWQLTRGNFWRLLGIMLLTTILVSVLVGILSVPFTMFATAFTSPDDIVLPLVLSSIGQLVGSALSIPVMAAVLALLYIDIRMRKEGLDVELARAAQAQ